MTCPSSADIRITDSSGTYHDLICDWSKGGAGLKIEKPVNLGGTSVSSKGDYGVRDSNDYMRIIQTSWVDGAGQKTYDSEEDSESGFEDSRSIDVGTKGEFKLGPAISKKTNAAQLPYIINRGTGTTAQTLWASFTDATTAINRVAYSTDGNTWTKIATAGPSGSPTSFATDGELLYMIADGKAYSLATGAGGVAAVSAETGLTHIAFASGQLYASKGTAANDAQLGFFSAVTGATWAALTPAVASAINAAGVTFGLVAKDSSVYWGVTNGTITKVYKAQYVDGSSDVLVPVATFPTGFVGACMYQYLGTVYVGGHFDGETTSTGIGTIYGISDDTPFLLTNIGTDSTKDNRVRSMSAYERSLYFVSNSEIWRWDLVNGGYSHWAGPLNPTATMAYSSISWAGTWAMAAIPGNGDEPDLASGSPTTSGTTSISYAGGKATIALQSSGEASRNYAAVDGDTSAAGSCDGISDTTGTTLEVGIPANAIDDHNHSTRLLFGIRGSSKSCYAEILKESATSQYQVGIFAGNGWDDSSSMNIDVVWGISTSIPHTFRLILKGTSVKLYDGTTLLCSGVTGRAAIPDQQIWFEARRVDLGPTDDHVTIDWVRWTDDGAFDPSVALGTSVTGVQLACWKDKVAAACSGAGITYTSTTAYKTTNVADGETPPYLRSSRSSGNMPTIDKYFSSIDVNFDSVVPSTSDVTVSGTIDGSVFIAEKDDDLSTDSLFVFPIRTIGRNIQYQINITNDVDTANSDLYTPVVTEVAVLFLPTPKQTKLYTYYVRVWDNVEDNAGGTWSEDAETVCDFIEEVASTVVTVERASGDSYSGKVEELEFIEAPPTSIPSGRQGLYRMDIRRMA